MGYFGHLVASRAAPGPEFVDAETEPGDWSPGLQAWRLPQRLGSDWAPFQAIAERLAAAVPGGFLAASVLDSDGALVHIGIPGRDVAWCWLHLDGFVSNIVLPWAPPDELGGTLAGEALAAQTAEWEREANAYAVGLRGIGLEGDDAAAACSDWAQAAGLDPAPVDVVRDALEAREVFVEETFHGLLRTLGCGGNPQQ